MNSYQKQNIMGESRHQFIYNEDLSEGREFIKSLEEDYPIDINSDRPVAIRLIPNGLAMAGEYENTTNASLIASEYLSFSIVYNILLKIKDLEEKIDLDKTFEALINSLNRVSVKKDEPIKDFEDLLNVLSDSMMFYYCNYTNKNTNITFDELRMPFIMLDYAIRRIKKAINLNSYFGIIVEDIPGLSLNSVKAVNDLINSRINADLSIKVFATPNSWKTYYDSNGQLIQSPHDYGTVDLDQSYSRHTRELKRKYGYDE